MRGDESIDSKGRQFERTRASDEQLRLKLADGGGELEGVAGAWTRYQNVFVLGMPVYQEVAVRSIREQTHGALSHGSRRQPGEHGAQGRPQRLDFGVGDLAPDALWPRGSLSAVHHGCLDTPRKAREPLADFG